MLETGTKAPDFTLNDKDGKSVSLSDFIGKKVVLYFYPKDSTPGCTRQACAFAGVYGEFKKKNVEVIGISKDSIASHVKFAEKYGLPFILLSDPDLEAIQAANRGISTKNLPDAENRGYGIITSKKMLVDGLGGNFIMMSGNALHLYNSEHIKFIEMPKDIRWNGTIIAFRVPYINKEFQYINYIE